MPDAPRAPRGARDWLRRGTVRTAADVTDALATPVTASLPRVTERATTPPDPATTAELARLSAAFATTTGVVGITSARPGDGKSSLTAHLAAALARSGRRVIAIGADLRRPTLHTAFGVANTAGVADLVAGTTDIADLLVPIAIAPDARLWFLPAGATPDDPGVVLASDVLAATARDLAGRCDLVLVDLPPVLAVSDPFMAAAALDAVVLVARVGRTRTAELDRTGTALRVLDTPATAAVLNLG